MELKALSRMVGFGNRQTKVHFIAIYFWILVNTFTGMIVLMVCFRYAPAFRDRNTPSIIPSWAASAILLFNAIESPLSQPWNVFAGTLISSFIGVVLCKLWVLVPENIQYLWVCGALSVAISSISMRLTRCIHPPAGAAALLPILDVQIRNLGWFYLAVQVVSIILILVIACLFNNIQRVYPTHWYFYAKQNLPNELKINANEVKIPEGIDLPKKHIAILHEIKEILSCRNTPACEKCC